MTWVRDGIPHIWLSGEGTLQQVVLECQSVLPQNAYVPARPWVVPIASRPQFLAIPNLLHRRVGAPSSSHPRATATGGTANPTKDQAASIDIILHLQAFASMYTPAWCTWPALEKDTPRFRMLERPRVVSPVERLEVAPRCSFHADRRTSRIVNSTTDPAWIGTAMQRDGGAGAIVTRVVKVRVVHVHS